MPQNAKTKPTKPSRDSNTNRANRLAEALASRLNKANDPNLSRMIIKDLAEKVGVEVGIVGKG